VPNVEKKFLNIIKLGTGNLSTVGKNISKKTIPYKKKTGFNVVVEILLEKTKNTQ
jgi:hypothetical protein